MTLLPFKGVSVNSLLFRGSTWKNTNPISKIKMHPHISPSLIPKSKLLLINTSKKKTTITEIQTKMLKIPTSWSSPLSPPSNPRNLQHLTKTGFTVDRRDLLLSLAVSITPFFTPNVDSLNIFSASNASARGLFQMPPVRLTNRYFLVRAGESEFESMGIINTNPVAKTSVDNGLSEEGKRQTAKTALLLKAMGACNQSCWVWPSITQRAYQAAEIIASVNGVGRSHIVPEYSFLDARGLGAFEGRKLDTIAQVYEADNLSSSIKPPPIDDGTPNESVADVFVRVTQLMSILETQYSGETVIIVSPDSDNLTVLQAGLVGLDLRRHNELYFGPGEVRYVDAKDIPTYKQPASGVYQCLKPPSCSS